MKSIAKVFLMLLLPCSVFASGAGELPETVPYLDFDRFSGPWYVYALIPTVFEKKAVNGIETYTIGREGNIDIEYVFYEKSPEGKKRVMLQKGWVINRETGAHWKIQPLWPFKFNYLVIDLAEDYRYSVIGTTGSSYVWVLSRTPSLEEGDYRAIRSRLEKRGYPLEKLVLMPQEWR